MNYRGRKAAIPQAIWDQVALQMQFELTQCTIFFCRSQLFSRNDKNHVSVSGVDWSRRNLVRPLWDAVNDHIMTGSRNPDLERKREKMEQYATRLEGNGQFLLESCEKMANRMKSGGWQTHFPVCESIGAW